MATVHNLLQSSNDFYLELQLYTDIAESRRRKRFLAVMTLNRMTRGYLIRKHMKWLTYNAIILQCAFRVHKARQAYRAALRRAVRLKHTAHFIEAAIKIQALWRGHHSRRTKFCYRTYRRWLATIKERGERRAAEAAEFGLRSRADDLKILEEEARQWLAFVVFKLHHLLRTYIRAGVFSEPDSTELSEFENLLKSIRYTQYMKRLKQKYNEFVKKHQPSFANKKLFPIIGDGADYWYLSLPEMYELSRTPAPKKDTRHKSTHHGKIHSQPFLWRKPTPDLFEKRGPFLPPKSLSYSSGLVSPSPAPPAPTPAPGGDSVRPPPPKDPRFHLYVKHYKPDPALFDYLDFHINALLRRKYSVMNIDKE